MVYSLILFATTLVAGGTFLLLSAEVAYSQLPDENNSSIYDIEMPNNTTSDATNSASNNKTIILNAAEVNETYRWINGAGAENPTLDIVSNQEYTVVIDNPTDEEHELIIDSAGGNVSEIAESGDIGPGKNIEFKFKTDQVGELGYHCQYHPDLMKGTIKVTEQ